MSSTVIFSLPCHKLLDFIYAFKSLGLHQFNTLEPYLEIKRTRVRVRTRYPPFVGKYMIGITYIFLLGLSEERSNRGAVPLRRQVVHRHILCSRSTSHDCLCKYIHSMPRIISSCNEYCLPQDSSAKKVLNM